MTVTESEREQVIVSRAGAYAAFKEKLLSGALVPGQFVTQKELASIAGVPIGTAREAIQKLELESLLKVHPQRGIQVADITLRFIRESYALRSALEKEAVWHFAQGGFADSAEALLDETQETLERCKSDLSDEARTQAVEVDWKMHDVVIDSMGGGFYSETYQINATRIRLIRATNLLQPDRVTGALQEHIGILEHCIACEPDKARDAMSAHIQTAMQRTIQGL